LLRGEVGGGHEVDAKQGEAALAEAGGVGRGGLGGGAFDDGMDLDGEIVEGGAEFGENRFGQGAGGRLYDEIGAAGKGVGEVGERRDGGAVGEADGGEDADAEREDENEQRGLSRGEAGVTKAQSAQQKKHGAGSGEQWRWNNENGGMRA
jgi:hypothetical protein